MAVAPVKTSAVLQAKFLINQAGGRECVNRDRLGDRMEFEITVTIGNDDVISDLETIPDVGVAANIVYDLVGVCDHKMGGRVTLAKRLELGVPFRPSPD
jgi:hypothetical protein